MGRLNPNSKRGSVRLHYDQHGEASAFKFGEKKGVKPSRLKRWFRLWGDKPKAKVAEPAAKKKTKRVEPKETPKRDPSKPMPKVGAKVRMTFDHDRRGVLVQPGTEQSGVKWSSNGTVVFVVNDWIEEDT